MITIRQVSTKLAKQLPAPCRHVLPATQHVCLSLGLGQDRNFSKSSNSNPTLQEKALGVLLNHTKTSDGADPNSKNKVDESDKKVSTAATTTTSSKAGVGYGDDVNGHQPSHTESKKSSDAGSTEELESVTSITPKEMKEEMKAKNKSSTNLQTPLLHEFAPKIVVVGVGGAGCNALDNMIMRELKGVDFLALNTDAQHLSSTLTDQRLQLGVELTQGLGCGANPDAGRIAAEEAREHIKEKLQDAHLVFITAGMGGGTGTGAAPVVADICYEMGILTVGVVTLPFTFEGTHRRRLALEGVEQLQSVVDTLIVIPNQNLFQIADTKTAFVHAFQTADDVLYGGVKSITDLITSPGLINLDFADVRAVMVGMGNALLGTGVCSDEEDRAIKAAQLALENPLLGNTLDVSTAKGMLVNITGGMDMTLFEVDQAAQLITQRVNDESANIIFGSAYDSTLEGKIRVSVVATGIERTGF